MNWAMWVALAGLALNILSTWLSRARLEGAFSARFDAMEKELARVKTTVDNSMARMEDHGKDIAVLMYAANIKPLESRER